jgi:hypothetical protein
MSPAKAAERVEVNTYLNQVGHELILAHHFTFYSAQNILHEFKGDALSFKRDGRGVGTAAMLLARQVWVTAWDTGAVELGWFHC